MSHISFTPFTIPDIERDIKRRKVEVNRPELEQSRAEFQKKWDHIAQLIICSGNNFENIFWGEPKLPLITQNLTTPSEQVPAPQTNQTLPHSAPNLILVVQSLPVQFSDTTWDKMKIPISKILYNSSSPQENTRSLCEGIFSYYCSNLTWNQIQSNINFSSATLKKNCTSLLKSGMIFAMAFAYSKIGKRLKYRLEGKNEVMSANYRSFERQARLTTQEQGKVLEGFRKYVQFRNDKDLQTKRYAK